MTNTRQTHITVPTSNEIAEVFSRDAVYQGDRDYWAVGARATALVVGAEARVHPLELADALAGFVFIDFLRADTPRYFLGLTISQLISVFVFLVAIYAWKVRWKT